MLRPEDEEMLTKVDYIMVVVSDMKRSVEFYRDTLGVPLKFESPEWTEFQTGATTLALHGANKKSASPAQDSSKVAGTCSIGFTVKSLEQTYSELRSKGVPFVMPPTAREGEGIKLAIALDPDGLPVSFSERAEPS